MGRRRVKRNGHHSIRYPSVMYGGCGWLFIIWNKMFNHLVLGGILLGNNFVENERCTVFYSITYAAYHQVCDKVCGMRVTLWLFFSLCSTIIYIVMPSTVWGLKGRAPEAASRLLWHCHPPNAHLLGFTSLLCTLDGVLVIDFLHESRLLQVQHDLSMFCVRLFLIDCYLCSNIVKRRC